MVLVEFSPPIVSSDVEKIRKDCQHDHSFFQNLDLIYYDLLLLLIQPVRVKENESKLKLLRIFYWKKKEKKANLIFKA